MKKRAIIMLALSVGLFTAGCTSIPSSGVPQDSKDAGLVGAWRGKVRFKSGSWAVVKDLEFLYVFNAGGTMTESSNYDGAPPVPPAYGVWRKVGPRRFEAKYVFFQTKAPAAFEDIAKGGGWSAAGYGTLLEEITLSEDGESFKSTIKYDGFDQAGKPVETGSEAETEVNRMEF